MRTIFYLLREAWANISTNRTTTMVAVLTTAFTLACVGIFLLLYVNLRAAAGWLQDDIKIMLYLDDRAIAGTVSDVEQQLRNDRAVAAFHYISKEQALGEFKAQFPSDSHLLEGLGQNPLPASFVVTLSPPFRSPDAIKRWSERIRGFAGVAKVDYNQDWIDALSTVIRSIELVAIGIGLILSAAAVTIIANTIRLLALPPEVQLWVGGAGARKLAGMAGVHLMLGLDELPALVARQVPRETVGAATGGTEQA